MGFLKADRVLPVWDLSIFGKMKGRERSGLAAGFWAD